MSEDALRAARMMQQAADRMSQVQLDMDGTVDRLERVLQQAACDGASLVSRMEELMHRWEQLESHRP